MKYPLSLCLLSLLFACGETRIESVDDETLKKAEDDRAAAELQLQQADLLGTWQGCTKVSDSKAWNHSLAFASNETVSLKRDTFAQAICDGKTATNTEVLQGKWKLSVAGEGKTGFVLKITLDGGKAIETEYKAGQFPRIFDLKDQSDLKLLELKNADQYVTLTRRPAGEAETLQQKAEKKILSLLQTEMKRKGVWRSGCDDGQITQLEFSTGQSQTVIVTNQEYKESECKTVADKQPDPVTYSLFVEGVTSLDDNKVQLRQMHTVSGMNEKVTIQVNFDNLDNLVYKGMSFTFGAKP